MEKFLMKGNEAIGKAAIEAGCRFYAGYPITPQNEVPEYMSRELPKVGGVFIQAESELASINMVYGAGAAGFRAMTSSSSPGISLMQEGMSFVARAGVPIVVVNVMRGGPGIGSIQPSQADYRMATKGGGNGDYHTVVYAPSSVQELVDLVRDAFDTADYYKTPVMVLADGLIGQMMEPVVFAPRKSREIPPKDWALQGKGDGEPRRIIALDMKEADCEKANLKLDEKFRTIFEKEQQWEEIHMEDAEYVIAAYGTSARICKTAIADLRDKGYKVGMIRPITLWPFPYKAFEGRENIKRFFSVEMSLGQMIDDVCLAVNDRNKVKFFGRTGGMLFTPEDVCEFLEKEMGGKA
ncbi:MAG: 3-methyl-2-oxobutanoate dehydrogenase subunit VorB [Firmicutes bacterium]|nr:3-methyl-2-oxobutanoate dehydrogenase subunit VorB [Bacillota bacterium]